MPRRLDPSRTLSPEKHLNRGNRAAQFTRTRAPTGKALLQPGITKIRLTHSKSWITNGKITREWTLDSTIFLFTPYSRDGAGGWHAAEFGYLLRNARRYSKFWFNVAMKRRLTTAPSDLRVILDNLPGGWHTAFNLLKEVADKDAESEEARLLANYEELASVDVNVPVERIIEGANMRAGRFLGLIADIAYEKGVRVSKLIAAINLQEVMERGVKEAKKATGIKDRLPLLQAAGLYPAPASTIINSSSTAIAQARASMAAAIDTTDGLDEFERDTLESTSFLRGIDNQTGEQKRIESPSNFVDAAIVKETVEPAP